VEVATAIPETYEGQGFVLLRHALPRTAVEELRGHWLDLIEEGSGRRFEDALAGEIVDFFREHRDQLSWAYDAIRERPWLEELATRSEITDPVKEILGPDVVLMKKIVFRVDVPGETRELAHWHQDHFYVRGDEHAVTAWIPLQDTPFEKGPLGVMPGSHSNGLLDHDLEIGKRHVPRAVLDREIRLVQTHAGDILLFHALLVHTSNLNLSDGIRYSIQARYSRASEAVDPGMGGSIAV
jgi:phytanoyl-CoA hydroxylase